MSVIYRHHLHIFQLSKFIIVLRRLMSSVFLSFSCFFMSIFVLLQAGILLNVAEVPFGEGSFSSHTEAVVSSMSVDADLCLALFERVADEASVVDATLATVFSELGRRIVAPTAATDDFVRSQAGF